MAFGRKPEDVSQEPAESDQGSDQQGQAADPGESPPSTSGIPANLRFILQETRCLLLQQILAHETRALSVRELAYRNPHLEENTIRYHLGEMLERDIVEKLEIPVGEQQRDLPSTFYGATGSATVLLDEVRLLDEIEIWEAVYEQMERTEEIERIEAMDRPQPDWV